WAIWACPGPHRYVRGIHRALRLNRRLLDSVPSVVIGDFNSHSIWDANYPDSENHTALLERLDTHELVSSYHWFSGESHGAESQATFFEYRHRHRPYHIDYCFVPKSWAASLESVTLGDHGEWGRRSDHMPLVTVVRGP